MSSRRLSVRHYLLHAGRVAMFVTVLLLIRWQHAKSNMTETSASAPNLEQVQSVFPDSVSVASNDGNGAHSVIAQDGTILGSVLQTSPDADHIIGFSGPTNVMIAFDTDHRVLGIEVISSGDTRDHLRQVVDDDAFMSALDGMTRQQAAGVANVDGVSGATLTSLAIRQAIIHRLGGRAARSLKFPEPPTVSKVAALFPDAASLAKSASGSPFWTVSDAGGKEIGTVLPTSPAADNLIGYQGPTETLIGLGPDLRIIGIAIGNSFDNEPYVGYVRQDDYFLSLFNGQRLAELAATDLESSGIEGVSGATMTSRAVAEGMMLAARDAQSLRDVQSHTQAASQAKANAIRIGKHDLGTALVICLGIVIGMTSLRGNGYLRIGFQLLLVLYLGWIAGNLVSQAMLVGWAKHGVPWRTALGLVMLSAAALAIPITTRRNLYCTHLCPHGALQQLVRKRIVRKSFKLKSRARLFLSMIPGMLLWWCLMVAMTSIGFSLVDIEPFDAYLFPVAGWATITVALVGLVASTLVPMAYCRYGCPTGALLQFLRFNAASDRWSARDWVAVSYTGLAVALYLLP